MNIYRTNVGLDVHARSVVAHAIDEETGKVVRDRLCPDPTVILALNRIDGALVTSTPKTKRSRRDIPLTPAVVGMLKAHKAAQAAERLQAGDRWVDEGWVFSTALGAKTS